MRGRRDRAAPVPRLISGNPATESAAARNTSLPRPFLRGPRRRGALFVSTRALGDAADMVRSLNLRACATHPAGKTALMLAMALLLFAGLEAALQVRSHIRYGQSVFNVLMAETRYVTDPRTGLTVLRPDHVFRSRQMEIRTNSQGLRSAPVGAGKAAGTYRIAVVGASTVMGAYAPRNEATFSHRLQDLLNGDGRAEDRRYEVINAGIAGYSLGDQTRMIEKVILPLQPDLIIVYPGFNDFAAYCRQDGDGGARPRPRRMPLHRIDTPSWLLAVDLVQKNTVALRSAPSGPAAFRSAADLDLAPYRQRLDTLIATARRTGVPLLLATNARAYRPEQPHEEQRRLSETARFYNPCFDLTGLHALYDLHNVEIAHAAARHGAFLIPLGELIPGGGAYFVDASHFSDKGEDAAARHLHRFLAERILAPAPLTPAS